ncbi:MAG TPA: 5-formyltetrahydrofolate cyclo-ligase [Candidatus Hydrogenedens sp.]|nr:5-formyltetrahydrofolate cyclo-ligase [Candidatus Hydrogenedens sp.]HOL20140.1 5-formyltetrahydrofolate cyclo-ligase [Candidatus Hydrogenedens sp.]HPP58562.1 5-formyltetrahydrofolate cyclo-ligase [Candidatus Hydrogenedens sp.]
MRLNKEELRRRILFARKCLPTNIVTFKSEIIIRSLISLPLFRSCRKVFTYLSDNKGEVETWGLVQECFRCGKEVWVPRIVGKDLVWHLIEENKLQELNVNTWGIPEPLSQWMPIEEQASDALCIVPGIAFDRRGYRIGHGKGFFDRFLKNNKRCINIGLCYQFQIVPLCPHWNWDARMDWVITEEHIFQCASSFR